MRDYQPSEYWESLLTDQYDLSGVGHPDFPVALNQALYDAMLDAVTAMIAAHRVKIPGADVLEIGPGTGFWVQLWERLGARSVTGVDISSTAVHRLSAHFPEHRFLVRDFGDDGLPSIGEYDVISAMSVLLHIVDSSRFRTALEGVSASLRPGGYVLLMEPLVLHRWWGRPFDSTSNSKARPLAEWAAALADAGLTLVDHRPVTALLNNVCDTKWKASWRLHQAYWLLLRHLLTRWPRSSDPVLAAVRRVDRLLVARGIAPSAKVMLLRHAG